jgi:hypothetical protein
VIRARGARWTSDARGDNGRLEHQTSMRRQRRRESSATGGQCSERTTKAFAGGQITEQNPGLRAVSLSGAHGILDPRALLHFGVRYAALVLHLTRGRSASIRTARTVARACVSGRRVAAAPRDCLHGVDVRAPGYRRSGVTRAAWRRGCVQWARNAQLEPAESAPSQETRARDRTLVSSVAEQECHESVARLIFARGRHRHIDLSQSSRYEA